MSLALGPTLLEVRKDVAAETNFAAVIDQDTALQPLVDRLIRKSYARLVLEFPWAVLRGTEDIELVDGQRFYEIPDHIRVGKIEAVRVLDSQDGDLTDPNQMRGYPLHRGIQEFERRSWTGAEGADVQTSMPTHYDFLNQQIEIGPAPRAATYPYLRVEGYFAPPAPRAAHDRMPVDREAIISLAVAGLKSHMSMPNARQAVAEAELYLERLKPSEGVGEGFRIGGKFSRRFSHHSESDPSRGQNGWYEGWTPRL